MSLAAGGGLISRTIAEVLMGRVLVHTTMSLDGFIAGPNDDMAWVFRHAGDLPSEFVDEVIARTGALLGGRRGYEVGRRAKRPEMRKLFGGRWSGPQFILTHTSPTDETDASYTFLSGDIGAAVATGLAAADGRDLLVLGANVVNQCLGAGLVDVRSSSTSYRSYSATGFACSVPRRSASLSRHVTSRHSGQAVNLRFRVDK
jgi:dihydrofolate reductase